jgi:hypothetical protein
MRKIECGGCRPSRIVLHAAPGSCLYSLLTDFVPLYRFDQLFMHYTMRHFVYIHLFTSALKVLHIIQTKDNKQYGAPDTLGVSLMPFCGEPVGISSSNLVDLMPEAWEREGMRCLPPMRDTE